MGDAAWHKQNREVVAKSRAKTDNASGKLYNQARRAAVDNLIANHVKEFDQLFRAEKYERGILR